MDVKYTAYQILRMLEDNHFKDDEKRAIEYIKSSLKMVLEDNKLISKTTKEWIIKQAVESGGEKFKLIGKVNSSGIQLMEWCDDAYNFGYMCPNLEEITDYKDGDYLKRTYTLEELPDVLDNALNWFNSMKSDGVFIDDFLHIMVIR